MDSRIATWIVVAAGSTAFAPLGRLGQEVAVWGDRVLVSPRFEPCPGASTSGSTHAFELPGGTWTHTHPLCAPTLTGDDEFGWSVAME